LTSPNLSCPVGVAIRIEQRALSITHKSGFVKLKCDYSKIR
jgi:hypothetical protein